jgi:hypothetical protein
MIRKRYCRELTDVLNAQPNHFEKIHPDYDADVREALEKMKE